MNTAEQMLIQTLINKTDSIASDVSFLKAEFAKMKSKICTQTSSDSIIQPKFSRGFWKIVPWVISSILLGAAAVGALMAR